MFRALLIAAGILAMHGAAQADVKLTADFVGPGTYSTRVQEARGYRKR